MFCGFVYALRWVALSWAVCGSVLRFGCDVPCVVTLLCFVTRHHMCVELCRVEWRLVRRYLHLRMHISVFPLRHGILPSRGWTQEQISSVISYCWKEHLWEWRVQGLLLVEGMVECSFSLIFLWPTPLFRDKEDLKYSPKTISSHNGCSCMVVNHLFAKGPDSPCARLTSPCGFGWHF